MQRLRGRSLVFWILTTALVAVVSYVFDVNTGAKIGPPYDDPWFNDIAFVVSRGAVVVLIGLVLTPLVQLGLRVVTRGRTSKPD